MKATTENPRLSKAEQLCEQRNVLLTPQRLEVLCLMSQQNGAINAYDLLDLLRQSEPQAKPPTVYLAMDFLLEQGFVHRVESTNSFVLCHHFTEPSHTSAFSFATAVAWSLNKLRMELKTYYSVWRPSPALPSRITW